MVVTLYGSPYSPVARGVAQVLLEKNVPFKYVVVDLQALEQKSDVFLKKNPWGLVPVLDDDGYILYESRAISRYIAEKYAGQGTPLILTDLRKKGLFEQAASIEASNFDVYAYAAVHETFFNKIRGLPVSQQKFEEHLKKLEAKLDVYEQILAKQKYLAGDELTLADLFHLPYGSMLGAAGADPNPIEARPNVARWFKELESRPSWQAVKDGDIKSTA